MVEADAGETVTLSSEDVADQSAPDGGFVLPDVDPAVTVAAPQLVTNTPAAVATAPVDSTPDDTTPVTSASSVTVGVMVGQGGCSMKVIIPYFTLQYTS